jgi:hypothetical protein
MGATITLSVKMHNTITDSFVKRMNSKTLALFLFVDLSFAQFSNSTMSQWCVLYSNQRTAALAIAKL